MSAAPGELRLRQALKAHLHPDHGSPYWLARQAALGFDVLAEIRLLSDLNRLGTMEPAELAAHPLEHFVPRHLAAQRPSLVLGQTGGTLGNPAWTVYSPEEFEEAFVRPFVAAARHAGFPASGPWLYVGPSGPHIIGQAARALARSHGMAEPFSVDFDPRWARKLAPGSFAASRYLQHVVDQALAVLRQQTVTVLFSTPVVLEALGRQAEAGLRRRIQGVHYGGQALRGQDLDSFRELFPEAVHLAGFGNTLLGCCMQLDPSSPGAPVYHAFGDRLHLGVIPEGTRDPQRISNLPGAGGRLVATRLDRSMLLVNLIERDVVTLSAAAAWPAGFQGPGLSVRQAPAAPGPASRSGLY